MEHRPLVFVPVNYQPSHPEGSAVHVFDAETGHHQPHLTVSIPKLTGAVDIMTVALAVCPGGAAVYPLVWYTFPQVACIPLVIDMQRNPPTAWIAGAGAIESGGFVEAAVGIAVSPDAGDAQQRRYRRGWRPRRRRCRSAHVPARHPSVIAVIFMKLLQSGTRILQ
jgi:hypothetical protein